MTTAFRARPAAAGFPAVKKTSATSRFPAALALAALALTCGCGKFFVVDTTPTTGTGSGGTSTVGCTDCIFVGSGTAVNLTSYDLSTAGALTLGSTEALLYEPIVAAVNPKFPYVYVSTAGGTIQSYSMGTTGVLTAANSGQSIYTGVAQVAMTVDPTGNYLLLLGVGTVCSNSSTSTCFILSTVTLDTATGATTTAAITTTTIEVPVLGAVAHQLLFSPVGTSLYAALGVGGIAAYGFSGGAVAASGSLYATDTSAQTSVNGLASDSTGATLYAGVSGTNGGLAVYTTASGLTAVPNSPFTTGDSGAHSEYAVAVAGANVYVSNAAEATITGYAAADLVAAASTTPVALAGSPYTSSTTSGLNDTIGLVSDSTGAYVVSINSLGSDDVNLFTVNSDGSLTLVTSADTGATAGTSGGPGTIAASASGT